MQHFAVGRDRSIASAGALPCAASCQRYLQAACVARAQRPHHARTPRPQPQVLKKNKKTGHVAGIPQRLALEGRGQTVGAADKLLRAHRLADCVSRAHTLGDSVLRAHRPGDGVIRAHRLGDCVLRAHRLGDSVLRSHRLGDCVFRAHRLGDSVNASRRGHLLNSPADLLRARTDLPLERLLRGMVVQSSLTIKQGK